MRRVREKSTLLSLKRSNEFELARGGVVLVECSVVNQIMRMHEGKDIIFHQQSHCKKILRYKTCKECILFPFFYYLLGEFTSHKA